MGRYLERLAQYMVSLQNPGFIIGNWHSPVLRGPGSGLRLASCVTLGQLLHLSEPWFPHRIVKIT